MESYVILMLKRKESTSVMVQVCCAAQELSYAGLEEMVKKPSAQPASQHAKHNPHVPNCCCATGDV
jgi:hypothetical protein